MRSLRERSPAYESTPFEVEDETDRGRHSFRWFGGDSRVWKRRSIKLRDAKVISQMSGRASFSVLYVCVPPIYVKLARDAPRPDKMTRSFKTCD